MRYLTVILYLGIIFLSSCHPRKKGHDPTGQLSLRPDNLEAQKVVRLSNGVINAVFVDNTAFGEEHRAGYNGIAELTHKSQDSSVFVPYYAGFNLEHIFGGDSLAELFEPRRHPMELYKISDSEVLLYQSPTPLSGVESQTVFKLTDSHYMDVVFRFIIHDGRFFKHGYAGLFWASYIHEPGRRIQSILPQTSMLPWPLIFQITGMISHSITGVFTTWYWPICSSRKGGSDSLSHPPEEGSLIRHGTSSLLYLILKLDRSIHLKVALCIKSLRENKT